MLCARMQRESLYFSVVLFTSLCYSSDQTFVLRSGNTLETGMQSRLLLKCGSFYDLELFWKWDGHPSKESNAQASGEGPCAVLRGASAGGNHPLNQKWAFSFCFTSLQSFDAVAKVRFFSQVLIWSEIPALGSLKQNSHR